MALEARPVRQGRISDLWNRPIEWLHTLSLRLLGWFTQERWTNTLVISALVVANLIILFFFLRGQMDYAIVFTIFVLVLPLMWFFPEFGVAVFIISGSSLVVNALYYASRIPGTGERAVNVAFAMLLSARAIYEYVTTPKAERPRVFTWFTVLLTLFWVYYMGHVAYIYLFRLHEPPPDSIAVAFGMYRPGIIRYFDYHILWIGVLPLIVLLRDVRRAKRALVLVGIVLVLGVATLVAEYFSPLPEAWKILFQIRAAGESAEGYRVREPAVIYLLVAGLFTAIYSLGYVRGWRTALAVGYIAAALYAVLVTKNRALWAPLMVLAPFALLWKPPAVLARQLQVLVAALLVFAAGMLNPELNAAVTRIWNEAVERWQRNYAFGGDPRNDPSYQGRIREREAWEITMARFSTTERLFGRGLEATYGFYYPISHHGFQGPRAKRIYLEKLGMHFSWLDRLLKIGIIGTALMALTIAAALIRITVAFLSVKHPYTRALLMGIGVATVALLAYDSIHFNVLARPPALPIILLWSIAELTFHWHRTGQLRAEPDAKLA
ncbi:MAG: hypothetical protein NZ550_02885 [Fimbriimonadales bacterium]|nr:hypothetical protein [Fimbriimonadales bacterium]MDW8051659.1 hypothetical protein [Armatimonadota bacterium]